MLLQQPRFGFTFSFQDRLMPHLVTLLDGCSIGNVCKLSCKIISKIANYLKYNYFWDGDGIENVTLRLSKFSDFCSRHTVCIAGDDIMFHILVVSVQLFIWSEFDKRNIRLKDILNLCLENRIQRNNILQICNYVPHFLPIKNAVLPPSGGRLNINMSSYRLILTRESPYLERRSLYWDWVQCLRTGVSMSSG